MPADPYLIGPQKFFNSLSDIQDIITSKDSTSAVLFQENFSTSELLTSPSCSLSICHIISMALFLAFYCQVIIVEKTTQIVSPLLKIVFKEITHTKNKTSAILFPERFLPLNILTSLPIFTTSLLMFHCVSCSVIVDLSLLGSGN